MIIGFRVGRRSESERRLKRVTEGVFVAPDAYRPNARSDYYEESPILAEGPEKLRDDSPEHD